MKMCCPQLIYREKEGFTLNRTTLLPYVVIYSVECLKHVRMSARPLLSDEYSLTSNHSKDVQEF